MISFFAVKHNKSGKLFLLLEDGLGSRMRVCNPNGDVLTLDEAEFDPDYLDLNTDNMRELLTEAQVKVAERFFKELAERDQIMAKAEEERKRQLQVTPPRNTAASSSSPTRPRRSSSTQKTPNRRFSRDLSWSSSQLSFYKHKIDPLGPKDVFVVTVYGQGVFRFTREAFDKNFNDVRMNSKYREQGVYNFDSIPERAMKFKIADDDQT